MTPGFVLRPDAGGRYMQAILPPPAGLPPERADDDGLVLASVRTAVYRHPAVRTAFDDLLRAVEAALEEPLR